MHEPHEAPAPTLLGEDAGRHGVDDPRLLRKAGEVEGPWARQEGRGSDEAQDQFGDGARSRPGSLPQRIP